MQLVEDAFFHPHRFARSLPGRRARARFQDREVVGDAGRLGREHDDAVAERQRFGHIMGDEHDQTGILLVQLDQQGLRVGAGLRILLSYIPIEIYAAKPFQRPDESVVYGFNIIPGW